MIDDIIYDYYRVIVMYQYILLSCFTGTHLTRYLASLPPNVLTPGAYSQLLHGYAAKYALGITEWSYPELKSMGMYYNI